MVKLGLYVRLEARPGKEQEVEALLRSALQLAEDEPGTLVWYAVKFDAATFAIFDAFATEEGRQDHLNGRIAAALMSKADELLAKPPVIERWDAVAVLKPRAS